jgi:hypothetical protein
LEIIPELKHGDVNSAWRPTTASAVDGPDRRVFHDLQSGSAWPDDPAHLPPNQPRLDYHLFTEERRGSPAAKMLLFRLAHSQLNVASRPSRLHE